MNKSYILKQEDKCKGLALIKCATFINHEL